MKSLVIAGLLSALMMGRVNSQVYYTYPEWDRLSDQARTMYIAGAYDTLVSIASPDTASTSRHYSRCVSGRLDSWTSGSSRATGWMSRPAISWRA